MSNQTTEKPYWTREECVTWNLRWKWKRRFEENKAGQAETRKSLRYLIRELRKERSITLNELVQVSNSYTVVLPDGTLVFVQHGQYNDTFGIQITDNSYVDPQNDELVWHLYGESPKAQVVAALQVLLTEGETWEPWHVTTAIEEAA